MSHIMNEPLNMLEVKPVTPKLDALQVAMDSMKRKIDSAQSKVAPRTSNQHEGISEFNLNKINEDEFGTCP